MTRPPARKGGKTNWGCVALVGVLLVGLYVIGRGAAGTETPAAMSVASQAPAPTVAAVAAIAQPTAAPTTPAGTRQKPVPFGSAYQFVKGGQTYAIEVVEARTNAAAAMQQASMFNPTAPEGEDYILVRIRLRHLAGPNDRPLRTNTGSHTLYADNRLFGAPVASTPPQPAFQGVDVFPGGAVDGWLDGKHLPKALMNDAVLVYDGVYFALK